MSSALIGLLALIGLGCERPISENSQVALQLPTYKNETALTCTKCLKAIIVNVNSENFKTIVFNQKMDKFSEAGLELTSEVVLDIPSGLARKIQILAIYLLSDSSTEVQYGSAVVDLLVAEPPPVTIALTSLGLFKGGSIVGRYLTLGDHGPTGNVIISMNHTASGMNMDIGFGEIIDGWFDLFASENFPMSYRFESGIAIPEFQSITLDNLMPIAEPAVVNYRARIHRPASYFTNRSSVWIPVNESHDIVYGFFGGSAQVPNKKVCIEHHSAPSQFSNLASTNSGTPLLTFDESANSLFPADIYGISGIDSVMDADCTLSNPAPLFTKDVISIRKNQFDGNGNDTARAKGGVFSYVQDGSSISKYYLTNSSGSGTKHVFSSLPGTFSGFTPKFNGIRLFKRASAVNGGFDGFKCNNLWLVAAGFDEVTVAPLVSIITGEVQFLLSPAASQTDGYILCPTKDSILDGAGGFYVGSLYFIP